MKKRIIPQMEPWFDNAEVNAVYAYMKSGGWVTEHKQTEAFADMLAKFIGVSHCVMVPNGTISLFLALLGLGIKAGDEVLVPDLTMIATPNAAVFLGIQPVFVDVSPETLCMDIKQAEFAVTTKTKAVVYVALNGRSGNMASVKRFCKERKLCLIEDAAQALGCYWGGAHLGTFGDIGSFSFSVPKVITTGQGGALVTNNTELYMKLKKLKDFGRESGGIDIHNEWGWNFKYTDIQAVIGIEQAKKLPKRLARKKAIYARYYQGLNDIPDIEFIPTDLQSVSPWFIDIYVEKRDALASHLLKKGVGTRSIYPAIHTQRIYNNRSYKDFPVSQKYAERGLWLPSSSRLSDTEVDVVVRLIRDYYS